MQEVQQVFIDSPKIGFKRFPVREPALMYRSPDLVLTPVLPLEQVVKMRNWFTRGAALVLKKS